MRVGMPGILLLGDMPETTVDLPEELTVIPDATAPVVQYAMGHTLTETQVQDGAIIATLCMRCCYVLASGERTPDDVLEVPLMFRRQGGGWICTVGKVR